MNPDQLADLAAAGESATLEFKKSTAEKERAFRTVCAFANGEGGRVVIGVTPAGKVVAQIVNERTLEELRRRSSDSSRRSFRQWNASRSAEGARCCCSPPSTVLALRSPSVGSRTNGC
ncbi:MAG: ATP-binding protein [Planctomycetes bacterium]|nr:ATP-binding protein [Planctomycetota bacterium]